ncbi:MAG: FkbM family methyltransferase [Lamprobacter sp.]|uniref:FkbM family methyltransferase n=1 Tax=Lamprobacter sp. TaxID=3100796 RepID=UPI002B260106|nr:FkbM family methyltransferase [Lamprobacter sp.]MEA3641493.1 FkbM family methyltransferase [Lamprobacter sp.]
MTLNELYQEYRDGKLEKHRYIEMMHEKHRLLFEYFDYIQDADVDSITITRNGIVLKTHDFGISMMIDQFDSRFIPIELMNFKSFDPVERELIFECAKHSKTIFDIGANIGWYTLNFCRLHNVDSVYSFEPIPRTYEYLRRHIDMNLCTKAILNNFALSDSNGSVEFFWNAKETGSSSMMNIQDRDDCQRILCPTRTVDSFCEEHGIQVDMIKCDVEGAELLVFCGSQNILERDKPFVFTEMLRKWSAKFGYHPNDIIRLFVSFRYRCFAVDDGVWTEFAAISDKTSPTNFFFFHDVKHADIIQLLDNSN